MSELAGWRQLSPLPESSCFPGAGRRTTSLAQARLPVMKRLIVVYIILTATAIVIRNEVPAEAELHTGITADLFDDSEFSWSSGSSSRPLLWNSGDLQCSDIRTNSGIAVFLEARRIDFKYVQSGIDSGFSDRAWGLLVPGYYE